jgi:hypothetical protein
MQTIDRFGMEMRRRAAQLVEARPPMRADCAACALLRLDAGWMDAGLMS